MGIRTIIFRGKRKSNGEWAYGNFVRGCVDDFAYIVEFGNKELCRNYVEVIPETVGQFTGLTDKNGKKIFEGDIISIPFEEDRYPYEENVIYHENAEVYFDTERYGWYVRCSDDDSLSIWEYDDCDIDIVVIGNIHDNPELLKGCEWWL